MNRKKGKKQNIVANGKGGGASPVIYGRSRITETDIYLYKEGTHSSLYKIMGSRPETVDGLPGTSFAVWAPNADAVSVIGDFNGWNRKSHPLRVRDDGSGVWEGFVPRLKKGCLYKYCIVHGEEVLEKCDPFGLSFEEPPRTATRVWEHSYDWNDSDWMETRAAQNGLNSPISIYEIHLGSWRRVAQNGSRSLTYREMADTLPHYIKEMGFTHVEIMPVMEHPFYGSWGYQITGYFAPTSRYGTPEDLMFLIDTLHQNGIGVILDWVPSHFPSDAHGLALFDGTFLYEHEDPRQGFHPEWSSHIFNYGRHEIRAFLVSNAIFWLDRFHADGLRVDAVASMLYLDYARNEGEWIPNKFGGNENLDAIEFLKLFNRAVYELFPDVQTIAEESTSWPMVSRPVHTGGLGFGKKWNMGWMHDTLDYFSKDPVYRKFHHDELTFSIWYAFSENFLLPLSHDEVVHGKGSLMARMPGDDWQRFANLRALYGLMYAHPGKKLLFMGSEIGQWSEWDHDKSLDWHLLEFPPHDGLRRWVADLNRFYAGTPALYERDFTEDGFEWIDCHDWEDSVLSFIRKSGKGEAVLIIANLTPVVREGYRVGVPFGGLWKEVLNSDAECYCGSNAGNLGGVLAKDEESHGRPYSLSITLPPLSVIFLTPSGK